MIISVGIPAVTLGADVSSTFSGHHVNAGTVSHEVKGGKHVLTLSKDFPVPDAPDPHWRLVDSKGNVFLLDRVKSALPVRSAAIWIALWSLRLRARSAKAMEACGCVRSRVT